MFRKKKYKLVITLKDGTKLTRQTSYSYSNWREILKILAKEGLENMFNTLTDDEGVTLLVGPNDEIRFIEVKQCD